MQAGLHIEGLDLLRKSIVISVLAAIVSAVGALTTGFGTVGMGMTAARGTSLLLSLIATLISLASWYYQFRGWGRLCETRVEGFFCTTHTAVKWGLLLAYILMILGTLVLIVAGPPMVRPVRPGRMPRVGALFTIMAGSAFTGIGGLIALIVAIIVFIAYLKLSGIYDAPNVKWGAILMVLGALLVFIGIGAILSLIGLALLYIGLGNAIDNVQAGRAPKRGP